MADGTGAATAARPGRKRRTTPLKTVLGFLLLRLAFIAVLLVPALPRRSWDTSKKYQVGGGITGTRLTHHLQLGVPLACAEVRWHEWSATRDGTAVPVTDEYVEEYARQVGLLDVDPRAFNLIMRWARLGTNAAIWYLPAFLVFYWIHARRLMVAAERRSKGLCGQCGYDLTGNVSGRCPECGASVDSGSARNARTARDV